jgi:hypothetical protein
MSGFEFSAGTTKRVHSGVVEKHLDLPELCTNRRECPFNIAGLTHIRWHRNGTAALDLDFLGESSQPLDIARN